MAVPKQKISKSKRGMRRAHKGLSKINVVVDQTTGEYKLPHHISLTDGYYDGEQVILDKEEAEDSSENEVA